MHSTFTVQSNGGVATTPYLLPYPPGKVPSPRFCIKMTAKDARASRKIERFRMSGKNLYGGGNHPPSLDEG